MNWIVDVHTIKIIISLSHIHISEKFRYKPVYKWRFKLFPAILMNQFQCVELRFIERFYSNTFENFDKFFSIKKPQRLIFLHLLDCGFSCRTQSAHDVTYLNTLFNYFPGMCPTKNKFWNCWKVSVKHTHGVN